MASTDSNPLAATASTSAIKRTAPESPKNTSDATTGGDSDGGVDVDSDVKGDGVGGDAKESLKAVAREHSEATTITTGNHAVIGQKTNANAEVSAVCMCMCV